jgi:hypothetical protein
MWRPLSRAGKSERMPVQWTIASGERLISVLGTGDVSRADIDGFLDAVMENAALGYAKLFDASQAMSSMTPADMVDLGTRFRSLHAGAVVGPLAIVMPPDRGKRFERLLGMIATADRPMRIFVDRTRARRWIANQLRSA